MVGLIACLTAVTSKVAVDSILAGAGLGMSIYTCSLGIKNAKVKKKK